MKKIRTNLYFGSKEYISKCLVEIVENELGFQPKYIASRNFCKTGAKYSPRIHLNKIKNSNEIGYLTLADGDENHSSNAFHFISIADWFITQVEWVVSSFAIPSDSALATLTAVTDFSAGYRNDNDDTYWQSADSPGTYEFHKRPHKSLPRIIHPIWNEERIDISGNPGRSTFFPGMKLQAAWQMWFGPGFFKYVPQARLLAFKSAYKMELKKTGVVFIQLYEKPEDAATSKAREAQGAFRRWIGMDELERQAFAIRDQTPIDPGIEIEHGNFAHGGAAKMIHWLNDNGDLSTKSKAVAKLTIEQADDGKEVWRKIEKI